MQTSFSFARVMFFSSMAAMIHGLFPFLFVKTGSNNIKMLYTRMVTHRSQTMSSGQG
ncbi:DUF6356 family protein [Crenobacter oryzisoli]|uniref:DUF6356 family protein n=1 Tax=Crenobacter oryzisoli TaxID=3056844 RepID=UPI00338D5172